MCYSVLLFFNFINVYRKGTLEMLLFYERGFVENFQSNEMHDSNKIEQKQRDLNINLLMMPCHCLAKRL